MNDGRVIWRERSRDKTSSSICVRMHGIGITCGGEEIVISVRWWHRAGKILLSAKPWKRKLIIWLLK